MPSIFDVPTLYDIVLPHPPDDLAREGRILELACGTCPHGRLLAQHGHRVAGHDRSPAMLRKAQHRATAEQVALELVQADLVDFSLNSNAFDAAIFMYETFPLLTEYDDLSRHFAVVRNVMKASGLYIIDLDTRKHGVGVHTGEWGRRTMTLSHGTVEVWHEDFPGDWVQGTSVMALHCRATLSGVKYETDDLWRLRVYSPWDLMVLMCTVPDWQLNNFFSWRELSTNIAQEEHYWMILEAV